MLAYSARPENSWLDFQIELQFLLSTENAQRHTMMALQVATEADVTKAEATKASILLRLLLQQANNKLVLFFDNLESVQDGQTQALTDGRLAAWLSVAQGLTTQGLIVLLTSRWRLPDWPEADVWPLSHASYGDFLRMAQEHLPPASLQKREQLKQVYDTLHGNGRGLTFFAAAVAEMDSDEEAAFLSQLAQAEAQTQTNMALSHIIDNLPADAHTLMGRLPAYQTPVPVEGIVKLALDLPQPERLLQRLLAVSLVEETVAHRWQCREYQLSPLVAAWLHQQGTPPPTPAQFLSASEYQQYLYRVERHTLGQAMVVHAALRAADQLDTADRFALD